MARGLEAAQINPVVLVGGMAAAAIAYYLFFGDYGHPGDLAVTHEEDTPSEIKHQLERIREQLDADERKIFDGSCPAQPGEGHKWGRTLFGRQDRYSANTPAGRIGIRLGLSCMNNCGAFIPA